VLSLAVAAGAVADSVDGDADVVTPGVQGMVYLGSVPSGATVEVDVGFELVCKGLAHVPSGTIIALTPTTAAPDDGTISAAAARIGPVPIGWPGDGEACVGDPVLDATTLSHVTLTAPSAVGTGYVYRVTYARSPSGGTTGTTLVQLALSVAGNTPPVLDLPAAITAEADAPGGWIATFDATASDAEDDPDPAVVCDPAPGDLLPIGDTTVDCEATDSGGLTAPGSFAIHVRDTTPPVLDPLPVPDVTTSDPTGAAVDWPMPAAVDAADPHPSVACDPAPGSWFVVGTTEVTCTAMDASGNSAWRPMTVTVRMGPPGMTVRWDAPLRGGSAVVERGRTLPVKVSILVGDAWLRPETGPVPVLLAQRLSSCQPGALEADTVNLGTLRPSGGRWTMNVRTGDLTAGCWRLAVDVGGAMAAGADVRLVSGPGRAGRPEAAPARAPARGRA
jgi:hypothetical protein